MHSRLRSYQKIADEHAKRHQHPFLSAQRQLLSEIMAHGHKSDVYTGQKQRQTGKCVHKTHADFSKLHGMESTENQLKHRAEQDDWHQCGQNLVYVRGQLHHKCVRCLTSVLHVRHGHCRVACTVCRIENAKQQHRQHRPDAAQRNQTKAVLLCAAIASDGS